MYPQANILKCHDNYIMSTSIFKKILFALNSITYNTSPNAIYRFPDINNPSLVLKIILVVCGILIAVSMLNAKDISSWVTLQFSYSIIAIPVTIAIIATVMVLRKYRPKISNRNMEMWIYASAIIYANLFYYFINEELFLPLTKEQQYFLVFKITVISMTVSSVVVLYLYYLALSLGPSNVEARLQSLTYRIRPHFLFNSLNAILSLIRRDPRKAEYALEELSELFRWLLKDSAQEVTIRKEIDIVQQFAAIEKVRLGERLNILWDIDPQAQNAIIPSLTLQPLVENAIYHGAESLTSACPISVIIKRTLGIITIVVSNPFDPYYNRKKGSGTALDTIRQRLELFFDIEFKIEMTKTDNIYTTKLQFPYRAQ